MRICRNAPLSKAEARALRSILSKHGFARKARKVRKARRKTRRKTRVVRRTRRSRRAR